MLSRMHQKLGTAGLVVAIVALVAALTGAAFAAGGGLTGKEKKEVKKIAKKFAGKKGKNGKNGAPGPAGPQGPKGDKGDKGDTGAPGTNGTNGTDGEDGMCSEARPECVLASNATLSGVWSASNPTASSSAASSLSPISFPVRVSPPPTALIFKEFFGSAVGLKVLENGNARIFPNASPLTQEEFEEDVNFWSESCPGSASEPEAAAGFLCIYKGTESGPGTPGLGHDGEFEVPNEFGVVVPWEVPAESNVRGSWAVTAQ